MGERTLTQASVIVIVLSKLLAASRAVRSVTVISLSSTGRAVAVPVVVVDKLATAWRFGKGSTRREGEAGEKKAGEKEQDKARPYSTGACFHRAAELRRERNVIIRVTKGTD